MKLAGVFYYVSLTSAFTLTRLFLTHLLGEEEIILCNKRLEFNTILNDMNSKFKKGNELK